MLPFLLVVLAEMEDVTAAGAVIEIGLVAAAATAFASGGRGTVVLW